MTFVTVGNATDGFRRLLNAVEGLAAADRLPVPVVIQSGHNPGYQPRHATTRPFMSMEEFEDHVGRARVVISHAGAGTVLQALAAGKVPVVMPRRARYGELIDDHQAEFAECLAGAGRVILAWEPADLAAAVEAALARRTRPAAGASDRLVHVVRESLEQLLR